MCFDVSKFAFLYGDYLYFQWFRKSKKRTSDDLKKVLGWKRLNRMKKQKFEEFVKKIWDSKNKKIKMQNAQQINTIVLKAFLYHLNEPLKYPILDRYVFQAMRILDNTFKRNTNKNINNWEKDYEKGYKVFFESLLKKEIDSMRVSQIDDIEPEIIKRRVLDRSLWELGRMPKTSRELFGFIDS